MISSFVLHAYRRAHFVYESGNYPGGELDIETTRTALLAVQTKALADHAAGVTISSISYESGSASGTVTGKPEEILEITEILLQELDRLETPDDTAAPRDRTTYMDFSQRRFET